jgi:hypothetical protein
MRTASLRHVLAALCAALLLVAARAPARAEGEGEPNVREFPEHNFKWTLPASWAFEDPSDDDKAAGFVVKAVRNVSQGVMVTAYVQVRDAGSTTVEQNLGMVAENKKKGLKDVEAKQEDAAWSGAPSSRRLRVVGMAENGSRIVWIVHGAIVSGKYHQLDLRCVNGAHHQIGDEVSAAVAGYRFLEGASDVPDAPPPGEGGNGGGNPLVRSFPKLKLTWTLPEPPKAPPEGQQPEAPAPEGGDPDKKPVVKKWGWVNAGNPDIDLLGEGLVAVAALLYDDAPAIEVRLALPKAADDVNPSDIVRFEGNFEGWKNNFESTPIPKIDEEAMLGNARGAFRSLTGKSKEGRPLYVRVAFASVKSRLFQVIVIAHDGAEGKDTPWLKSVLDGLKWEDTKTGVRGPWAVPFRSRTESRGSEGIDAGKKAPFKSSAMSLTKPAAWERIKFSAADGGFETWVFAAEAREGDAYVFAGVQRFDAASMKKASPPKEPDTFVDDLENDWRNTMDEPVTRPKSEKTNRAPGSFATGKGWQFEFTGKKEGQPWVERGWVVQAKGSIFIVRVQFGGKDAEKLLKDDWDDLRKSIRFE